MITKLTVKVCRAQYPRKPGHFWANGRIGIEDASDPSGISDTHFACREEDRTNAAEAGTIIDRQEGILLGERDAFGRWREIIRLPNAIRS